MAVFDAAVYRDAAGGDTLTGGPTLLTYDTTVIEDGAFSIDAGRDTVTVGEDGPYLIAHSTGVEEQGAHTSRKEIRSRILINSSASQYTYGHAYVRCDGGASFGSMQAAAILDLEDGDTIEHEFLEIDSNANEVQRMADRSALQLVRLPDDWDYLRVRRTSNSGILTTGFTSLAWQTTDREDAAFSVSGSSITVDAGVYLLLLNITATTSAGTPTTRNNLVCRVQADAGLGFQEVPGTRVSGFIRNANSCNRNSCNLVRLIRVPTDGVVLRVQVRTDTTVTVPGGIDISITAAESGLCMARIGDFPDYDRIQVYEDVGGQSAIGGPTDLTWDFTLEEDVRTFDHQAPTTEDEIDLNRDDRILVLWTAHCDRTGTASANRLNHEFRLKLGGTAQTWGGAIAYNRGVEATEGTCVVDGASHLAIYEISGAPVILEQQFQERAGHAADATAVFPGQRLALQALNLTDFTVVRVATDDDLAISDEATPLGLAFTDDDLELSDEAVALGVVAAEDSVAITDEATPLAVAWVDDALELEDQAIGTGFAAVEDTLGLSDEAIGLAWMAADDTLGISDEAAAQEVHLVSIDDGIGISDEAAYLPVRFRPDTISEALDAARGGAEALDEGRGGAEAQDAD